MSRGKASGYKLTKGDAAIVLGMVARDDRDHDIAAWFGVNQGRIAEVKEGRYGAVAAPAEKLPPKGPPGVKGRRLRAAVDNAVTILDTKGGVAAADAAAVLKAALKQYDAFET